MSFIELVTSLTHMLYLWTTAKAKWLLVALLLFCMHLHETKSIVYFDHFWCRLKRTMNKWILNYLWKLCWIFVGMFNKEFHLYSNVYKHFPIYSQCLFAFGFLPFFSEVLMHVWWCSIEILMNKEKLHAVLMQFCFCF